MTQVINEELNSIIQQISSPSTTGQSQVVIFKKEIKKMNLLVLSIISILKKPANQNQLKKNNT